MIARFKIGETYACRSACDWDCIFSARVVARTEKTVTFDEDGRRYTRRPHLWHDVESVYPHGQFSMCPVFSADRTYEDVINPPTMGNKQKGTDMKTEPKHTVHAETAKPAAKASAPVTAKPKPDGSAVADKVAAIVKGRAAALGIDPKKVFVGVVGAKPEAKPQTAPAPAAKPVQAAEKAKPDKPAAPAAPSDEETGRAWRDMAKRHAAEMAAFGIATSPAKGTPCVRFISGICVPAARAAEYRALVDRHRDERAKMRDNAATARGVYLSELQAVKGDEIAALYALGLPHIADKGGAVVPVIRGNRALAVAWRDALAVVSPGKVSQIVTVRALGAKADKPAEKAKKAPAPADKPDKPAPAPAAKPADKPAQADRPKGLGMIAKIEAKPDKPAEKPADKPKKAKPAKK